jgi:hypothetical protein
VKTVRVRIAVAVDEKGRWACSGWNEPALVALRSNPKDAAKQDESDRENAVDELDAHFGDGLGTHHVVFVEADVPIPEAQVVQGEVKA